MKSTSILGIFAMMHTNLHCLITVTKLKTDRILRHNIRERKKKKERLYKKVYLKTSLNGETAAT